MTQAQGPFAQLPYSLWTFPDLLPLERWLCATIIRLCWKPGPQAFSYRTIAKESGISIGSLCHSPQHEGMIPKLERLKLIKTYKPVDDDKKIKKGIGFLVEPTDLLWQLNHQEQGAYSVSTSKPESVGEGAYSVNATAYLLSTGDYPVSTSAQSVSTKRGVTQGQKHDEKPPIYIDKEDSNISLVASASAESNGGISFLSQLHSFEETLKEVQHGSTITNIAGLAHSDDGYSYDSDNHLAPHIINGQAPLYTSCIPDRHEGEPVKPADTSLEPAATSAAHDTTPDEEALQEIPTQVALIPAVQIQTTKPASPTKTHEKGDSKLPGKKDTRSPEERTRCQKWQAFFNARRGGEPLSLKGPRINESECIISLVQKFTDEQITSIDTFVLAEIFPYKLPTNKHKVGARIVLDESQNAREVLKERFKWPTSGTSSGSISSSQSGPKPDKYILHMRKLTQVSHASQAILEGREMPPLVGEYFTPADHEDYRKRVLEMVEDGRACYEKEKVAL